MDAGLWGKSPALYGAGRLKLIAALGSFAGMPLKTSFLMEPRTLQHAARYRLPIKLLAFCGEVARSLCPGPVPVYSLVKQSFLSWPRSFAGPLSIPASSCRYLFGLWAPTRHCAQWVSPKNQMKTISMLPPFLRGRCGWLGAWWRGLRWLRDIRLPNQWQGVGVGWRLRSPGRAAGC